MSLINDALKRASESDKKRPAQAPLPLPMQPAAAAPRGDNAPWLLIVVAVIAALGLVVSCWLYLTSRNPAPPVAATISPTPVARPVVQSPASVPTPAPVVQKALPPLTTSAPIPIAAATPVQAPAPLVAPPETFPTNLTVKAIFYSKANPRALLNGQTVETGDKIGDVLITGIMADRIFRDWKGQTKVLMMGGQYRRIWKTNAKHLKNVRK